MQAKAKEVKEKYEKYGNQRINVVIKANWKAIAPILISCLYD